MILVENELKTFKKKVIDKDRTELKDLYEPISDVADNVILIKRSLNKDKISEKLLQDDIEEKKNEIALLKRQLKSEVESKERLSRKVVLVLDQIDNIYRFSKEAGNEKLISNMENMMKIISKELGEAGFEEIPSQGQIFNSRLHECVGNVEDSSKQKYQIVDVIRRGYRMDGNIIRPASVIAVK